MALLDRSGDPFGRALDNLRRSAEAGLDDGATHCSPASLGLNCVFGLERGAGGEARWGLAMDWAEAPPQAGAEPASAPRLRPATLADLAEAVAEELGFTDAMTAAELAARWRAFVWANHPDRQTAEARETANARVALANALYDEARRKRPRA
jgi:hypothetical protein